MARPGRGFLKWRLLCRDDEVPCEPAAISATAESFQFFRHAGGRYQPVSRVENKVIKIHSKDFKTKLLQTFNHLSVAVQADVLTIAHPGPQVGETGGEGIQHEQSAGLIGKGHHGVSSVTQHPARFSKEILGEVRHPITEVAIRPSIVASSKGSLSACATMKRRFRHSGVSADL